MKKVVFSLKSIALVAVASLGMVSCGDEDPAPAPTPETPKLTENFIQVNDEQEEIIHSIYAVHTDGAGENAPIKEYTLNDGTIVAAFEFISHNGSAAGSLSSATADTWVTLLTKVDTTKAVGEQGRVSLPYTVEGATLLGGFATSMNDTNYTYAQGATFNVTALDYSAKTMTYTLEGTDEDDTSVELKANLDGAIQGLYSLNVSGSKGINGVSKNGTLTLRK